MPAKHVHKVNGQLMIKILDYQTFTVGCEECGPQWVVTTNWVHHTLTIAWVNAPARIYFDADRMLVLPDNDCLSWRPPRGPDDQVDESTSSSDA